MTPCPIVETGFAYVSSSAVTYGLYSGGASLATRREAIEKLTYALIASARGRRPRSVDLKAFEGLHETGASIFTRASNMSPSRPVSPFLIYRPQITWVLSICHRFTGVALSIGTLLLVWWLMALATSPQAFADVQAFVGSWLGRLLLLGWSFSLFFHLANGIRHLCWDAGYGFDIKTTTVSGWIVVVVSVLLTAIAWVAGLAVL